MTTPNRLAIAYLSIVLLSGCSDLDPLNRPPIAAIRVLSDDEQLVATRPVSLGPAPVTITLDARTSSDPDGQISEYRWLRSDVPGPVRYPELALPGEEDAGDLPAGTGPNAGDLEPAPNIEVTLPAAGRYRYSLYVRDNEGDVSRPASVTLIVDPGGS
ncbi:MAG TPA: hypothetical protein VFG30_29570 [Polyangiales bacterium]|nr:hypothetical protein [Polyangiales bacterium]